MASESPRDREIELKVGTKEWGEVRLTGAPGHPQSGLRASLENVSGDEYAGKDVFACVAWQERI